MMFESRRMTWCVGALAMVLASTGRAELLVNGDFQSGVLTPSTSAYSGTGSVWNPETWAIVSYDTLHGAWVDFYDHTTGDASGRFMVVNGSDSGVGPTWAQQVAVSPEADYTMSGWFALCYSADVSLLMQVADGTAVIASTSFSVVQPAAVWQQVSFTFYNGSASSLSVEIWDTNRQFGGNDYAIDDLSLTAVPEPSALALLGVDAVGLLAYARRKRRAAA